MIINDMLLGLGLPLECGRIVTTNGSCFYDSVLALLEDTEIKQSISSCARNITTFQELRLALANFMETNDDLHGLAQFQIQKEITLASKNLTWPRYLLKIKEPNEWADELIVMCMAIFLGKDIMQVSSGSIKENPWYRIPGQIEGWPALSPHLH